jgi:hypothetical protein
MNYKLYFVGCFVLAVNPFLHSAAPAASTDSNSRNFGMLARSQQMSGWAQRSGSFQMPEMSQASGSTQQASEVNMAFAMFQQNFSVINALQETNRNLLLQHAAATTALGINEALLSETKTELKNIRAALDSKVHSIHRRDAQHERKEAELKQALEAAQKARQQEVAGLQRANKRNIFATFFITAASSVGIGWLLQRFKILEFKFLGIEKA